MSAHDTTPPPDATGIDRREFLRLSSAVAAAGALASTACQVPPEAAIPFHDMPENLVDGMGKARYFHTVIEGTPAYIASKKVNASSSVVGASSSRWALPRASAAA